MRRFISAFVTVFLFSNSTMPAGAVTLPPITVKHVVEGIEFTTPITVDIGQANDQGLPYTALVNLQDIKPTLNTLADRRAGGDITHKGTNVWVENGLLKVKVHLKYHVGGLIGSTNGSVLAVFQARVTENAVVLVPTAVDINISNDLARISADLTGFRDDLRRQILQSLTDVLGGENASLALPSAVRRLGVTLDEAHFEDRDGVTIAVLSGRLPAAAAVLLPHQ